LESLDEIPLEQMTTEQLSQIINFRELGEPLIIRGIVLIPISDFVRSETALMPVGEGYTKQYALQKTLLRYEHNLPGGFSNPVHELFATVNDIEHADRSGKIVVEDEYLDEATRISHQRRTFSENGNIITETFITDESGNKIIIPGSGTN
jgi:hypothetical protein